MSGDTAGLSQIFQRGGDASVRSKEIGAKLRARLIEKKKKTCNYNTADPVGCNNIHHQQVFIRRAIRNKAVHICG